jgi:hypothetical protein
MLVIKNQMVEVKKRELGNTMKEVKSLVLVLASLRVSSQREESND